MIHIRWRVAAIVLLVLGVGCSQQPTPLPAPVATPIPPIELNPTSGSATASGEVVPAHKAELGFLTAGRVLTLAVDVGHQVKADSVLAALDPAAAEGAVAQAEASLQRAQALLAELRAGSRPQEIAAAQARLETAQANLAQLSEGARPDQIAAAQAKIAAAQATLQELFGAPGEEERIVALAELANAEAALRQAQAAYDQVAWRSDVGTLPESRQLEEATNNHEAAQARYDALFADPSADAVAAAQAGIKQAQAELDELQTSATAGQIAAAEAQVRAAQAELDLLSAGAQDESIAVAAAAVAEAEAALQRAQTDLTHTELRAPFDGTVTALAVERGELVLPGQTVLTLADLSQLRVETTDLSERDVARVAEGQAVSIYVEALDTQLAGRVVRVAPQADVIGGDVVYQVLIELNEQRPDLRWGMSVDVEILSDP
jgi:multidrug efflux pump subunit AcrA (membrane-fusion protein)